MKSEINSFFEKFLNQLNKNAKQKFSIEADENEYLFDNGEIELVFYTKREIDSSKIIPFEIILYYKDINKDNNKYLLNKIVFRKDSLSYEKFNNGDYFDIKAPYNEKAAEKILKELIACNSILRGYLKEEEN